MNKLISKIALLESKKDNGSITFEEDARLNTLIELAEGFIYGTKGETMVYSPTVTKGENGNTVYTYGEGKKVKYSNL